MDKAVEKQKTVGVARGRFITLEGGEGTGKTTQRRLLVAALKARGIDVVETREPGGSPGAEILRDLIVRGDAGRWDPLSEVLLFTAARRDHLVRTIWPALEAGQWVLSDRFADSTLAYQGFGHGLALAPLRQLYGLIAGDFKPDLTLVLDIDPELGVRRSRGGTLGEDRFEQMDLSFHHRLRQGFLTIAAEEPERCAVIDASGTPEDVGRLMWQEVTQRLLAAAAARS